jgi:hypothetical protein
MSPSSKAQVDQVSRLIREILGDHASNIFIQRLDSILNDWAVDKFTATQSCEKIVKNVSLFIDEDKAREISDRCEPIFLQESVN